MQKTLKISLLDKVYTITTDENEQCVVRAVERVKKMFDGGAHPGAAPHGDHGKFFVLPLLQLALELEKALSGVEETALKIAHLEKTVSEALV